MNYSEFCKGMKYLDSPHRSTVAKVIPHGRFEWGVRSTAVLKWPHIDDKIKVNERMTPRMLLIFSFELRIDAIEFYKLMMALTSTLQWSSLC